MSVKPWDLEDWPTVSVFGAPKPIEELRRPLTFEDYASLCESDGAPPPAREEYEAVISTPLLGEIGRWLGITFTDG